MTVLKQAQKYLVSPNEELINKHTVFEYIAKYLKVPLVTKERDLNPRGGEWGAWESVCD